MLIPLRFSLGDTAVYSRAFKMTARQAEDLSEPLAEIGLRVIAAVGQQFLTEGEWGGTPWPQMSPRYALWKEEHYPGRPLLVREALMRRAMLDPEGSLFVSPKLMIYQPDSDIALYHQEGVPERNLPPRPMLAFPAAELHEWDRIMVAWLTADDPLWGRF